MKLDQSVSLEGLSNAYVEKIGRKIIKNSFFYGVYPCDLHPKLKKSIKTFSIIFNTGTSDTNGKHFVAIYSNPKRLYYFDSFGDEPNAYIKEFIKNAQSGRQIVVNRKQIQNSDSVFCGYFCLAYLLSKDKSLHFFNHFSEHRRNDNDGKVIDYIVSNIMLISKKTK